MEKYNLVNKFGREFNNVFTLYVIPIFLSRIQIVGWKIHLIIEFSIIFFSKYSKLKSIGVLFWFTIYKSSKLLFLYGNLILIFGWILFYNGRVEKFYRLLIISWLWCWAHPREGVCSRGSEKGS